MFNTLAHYLLVHAASAAAVLVAAGLVVWGVPGRTRWVWAVAAVFGLLLVARTVHSAQSGYEWGADFRVYWKAGTLALSGHDPYSLKGELNTRSANFLHPPPSIPLFMIFALVPMAGGTVIAAVVNVLICGALGLLTRKALLNQDDETLRLIDPATAALLTAPIALSRVVGFGIEVGNVSFLVFLAIIAALMVPKRSRWAPVAGACLAVAAIKVQVTLPFLLLFLRKSDRPTWVVFILLSVASLTVAAACHGDSGQTPVWNRVSHQVEAFRSAVENARQPGNIIDYSLANRYSHTIYGIEHALSRLGITNRSTVELVTASFLAPLGLWLLYLVTLKPQVPRAACCALIGLYAAIFFHHRLYDLAILIIPIIYCASRFRVTTGLVRCCHAWVLIVSVLVPNIPFAQFYWLQLNHPTNSFLMGLVVPSITYLVLSGLLALAVATRMEYLTPGSPFRGRDVHQAPGEALLANRQGA